MTAHSTLPEFTQVLSGQEHLFCELILFKSSSWKLISSSLAQHLAVELFYVLIHAGIGFNPVPKNLSAFMRQKAPSKINLG